MQRRRFLGLALVAPPVLFVLGFVGFPIAAAVAFSLGHLGGPNQIAAEISQNPISAHGAIANFDAYRHVFNSRSFVRDLWATIWITIVSVIVVVVVSWGIALYLRLTRAKLSKLWGALSIVPLFIPSVIASYAIVSFWDVGGMARTVTHAAGWNGLPPLGYTLKGVVLTEVWMNIPFGVLLIGSGLQSVPTELIDAARDQGASLRQAALRVVLPMTLLPTVIVATFTAVFVLGSFTIPYVVGPAAPTMLGVLTTMTFQSFNQPQEAEVIAIVLFLLAAAVGGIYVWANVRASREAEVA